MPNKETVTKIIDGDTFKTSKRKHFVRLNNVDTPEKNEKGSKEAKNKLKKLIGGKKVLVKKVAVGYYNRTIANVYVGRESINKKMKEFLKN